MSEPVHHGTAVVRELEAEIRQAVIGQDRVIRDAVLCLLASGHALVEGVPGLGKTLLVRCLARTLGGASGRIQFTPDLMPSDVTGHAFFNMQRQEFEIRKGPIFTNFLLADEINRAPAKTQAALLEVMQEGQVTIEGESFEVPEPFMVLATQNPIEQDGTYPLPEAELDRFMVKLLIDYPLASDEVRMVRQVTTDKLADTLPVDGLRRILEADGLRELQLVASRIDVDEAVLEYAVRIVAATRSSVGFHKGSGPRGSIALIRLSRALALVEGRDFVIPDDVKSVALPVLRHRVQLTPDLEIEGVSPDQLLSEMLDNVEAPRH